MFKDFADFTGRSLQDYHRASNHVATKITRLEQEWQHDHDTIVSTKTMMDELRELVAETTKANAKAISELNTANAKAISELNTANAKAISDLLTAINTVCSDTTTAVNTARWDTTKIFTQFSQTIGTVRTTAEEAKGLATNARVLAGNAQEKVTLFANAVDHHDTQLGKLQELGFSVAKLGQEVVELWALIQCHPPALDAGVRDTATAGARAEDDSPLDRDTGAQHKSPLESIDCSGLGLDASDRYTTPTEDANRTAETAPAR